MKAAPPTQRDTVSKVMPVHLRFQIHMEMVS
jgi:hypothetical protein